MAKEKKKGALAWENPELYHPAFISTNLLNLVVSERTKTHRRMRKGWMISVSTSFSLWTCCSCFSRITSEIFICFRAKKALLFLSLTRKTRPKVPVPEEQGEDTEEVKTAIISIRWNHSSIYLDLHSLQTECHQDIFQNIFFNQLN